MTRSNAEDDDGGEEEEGTDGTPLVVDVSDARVGELVRNVCESAMAGGGDGNGGEGWIESREEVGLDGRRDRNEESQPVTVVDIGGEENRADSMMMVLCMYGRNGHVPLSVSDSISNLIGEISLFFLALLTFKGQTFNSNSLHTPTSLPLYE